MLKSTNRLLGSYLVSFKSFHTNFILFKLILIFAVLIFPSVSFANSGWYFNYNYVNIRSYTLNESDIVVGQIAARFPSSCYDGPYLNNNTAVIYEYGTDNVFPTCDGIIPPEIRYETATAINSSGKVIGVGTSYQYKDPNNVLGSFLWDGTQIVFHGTIGDYGYTCFQDINDAGIICGSNRVQVNSADTTDKRSRAVIFSADLTSFDTLGWGPSESSWGANSYAYAINNSNYVVGYTGI